MVKRRGKSGFTPHLVQVEAVVTHVEQGLLHKLQVVPRTDS